MTPAISPETVHIAICSDAGYLVPAIVLLTSAKQNKNPDSRYCIHFMQTSPCPGLEEKLQKLQSPDFVIILDDISIEHMKAHCCEHEYITATTYARFELCSKLPELEKILYIDCDALVLKDLTELYSRPMGECPLAACPEPEVMKRDVFPYWSEVVGNAPYVNAGVLLMNLKAMRKSQWSERAKSTVGSMPKHWILMDQDAINHLSHKDMMHLPPRYNYLVSTYRGACTVEDVNALGGTNYKNWDEADADAVIVHLAGKNKPWDYLDVPSSDLWMFYYHLSPCGSVLRQRKLHCIPDSGSFGEQLDDVISNRLMNHIVHRSYKVYLFDFLPLFCIRTKTKQRDRSVFRLFGFIPLCSIRRRAGQMWLKLFGFLPLLKIKAR